MNPVEETFVNNVNWNTNAQDTVMRRQIVEMVSRFIATDDSVQYIYGQFISAVEQARSNPNAVATCFRDAKKRYEEYKSRMESIRNDVNLFVQEQEQYLGGMTVGAEDPDEGSIAEVLNRIEQLERENNNLKVNLEYMKALYLEAKNMNEKLMTPRQARTPVQVEDDIDIHEKIKRQLNNAKEEKDKLEDANAELKTQLQKAEDDTAMARIGQQKASMEVCWTLIDCLRTHGGVTHHDIDAVISHGNLSVRLD